MSSERPSIQILPGDMAITMQLVWLEPPNNIIIKRWPLSEWTPDDSDASHSLGVDFVSSWMTHWKKTTNISFNDPKAQEFTMDPIEWIDSSNADRIKALNLNQDDDFPSGFYINNPTKEVTPMTVDRKEFLDCLSQFPDYFERKLFWVEETDGNVEFIKVHYVPGKQ